MRKQTKTSKVAKSNAKPTAAEIAAAKKILAQAKQEEKSDDVKPLAFRNLTAKDGIEGMKSLPNCPAQIAKVKDGNTVYIVVFDYDSLTVFRDENGVPAGQSSHSCQSYTGEARRYTYYQRAANRMSLDSLRRRTYN